MPWEPTDEEVRAFIVARGLIPYGPRHPWCPRYKPQRKLLLAAWSVSPGPGLEARVAELESLVGGWYAAARLRGLCPSSYEPKDPFYPEGEILGRGETARLRARVAELEEAMVAKIEGWTTPALEKAEARVAELESKLVAVEKHASDSARLLEGVRAELVTHVDEVRLRVQAEARVAELEAERDLAEAAAEESLILAEEAGARVAELEADRTRLREVIEEVVDAFETDFPFDSNVRLVVDQIRAALTPTKEETDGK